MNQNILPPFAALIGLDWGDKAHAIALQPADAATETSTLPHSAESVHQWLEQLEQRFGGRPVAVAVETDQGPLVYALLERPWITVYPIHPATSARHRKMFRPSGAADDLPDALTLLSLLQHFRQRLRPLLIDDESTRCLARLVEARRKAVDRRTLLLNQLVATLKSYFPQALELLGQELSTQLALDFLSKWPSLTNVQAAKPATLKSFYHRHNVRRPQLIQKRIDRVGSARLLTTDPAIIEVNIRIVRLLVAELRVLLEHIALTSLQMASRPLALLDKPDTLQGGPLPPPARTTSLSHRRTRPRIGLHHDHLNSKIMMRGSPQMSELGTHLVRCGV
jgi:hypothetical protein